MNSEDEKIVMPGEKIGIIEQYMPGAGAYDDEGDIKSAILGKVKINKRRKVIHVVGKTKPAILRRGNIIFGQITDLKPQKATVKIERLKDSDRALALPYSGVIHISRAKKGYLTKISDAFRIGDIVEARVDKVTGDSVDLNTLGSECGVLNAMCTNCRSYMKRTPKRNEVKCIACNKKEKRQISRFYINE